MSSWHIFGFFFWGGGRGMGEREGFISKSVGLVVFSYIRLRLFICQYVYQSIHLSVCLSIYIYIFFSFLLYFPIYLSKYLSIDTSIYQPIYIFFLLSHRIFKCRLCLLLSFSFSLCLRFGDALISMHNGLARISTSPFTDRCEIFPIFSRHTTRFIKHFWSIILHPMHIKCPT